MPNRILRDWTDSFDVDALSAEAERFFTRLIMVVDDYGRFHADSRMLKSKCFPLKTDIDHQQVTQWLLDCRDAGLLKIYYDSNARLILEVKKFNQRSRSASKFPGPDDEGVTEMRSNDGQLSDKRPQDAALFVFGDVCVCEDEDVLLSAEADAGETTKETYPSIVEELWKIAPPKARDRSSKLKVEKAWKATRPKPFEETVIASYREWSMCHDWTKDGGQFAPGVHVWIKDRKWESPPNNAGQSGKPTYRQDEYPEEEHVIRDLLPNPPTNTSR